MQKIMLVFDKRPEAIKIAISGLLCGAKRINASYVSQKAFGTSGDSYFCV